MKTKLFIIVLAITTVIGCKKKEESLPYVSIYGNILATDNDSINYVESPGAITIFYQNPDCSGNTTIKTQYPLYSNYEIPNILPGLTLVRVTVTYYKHQNFTKKYLARQEKYINLTNSYSNKLDFNFK